MWNVWFPTPADQCTYACVCLMSFSLNINVFSLRSRTIIVFLSYICLCCKHNFIEVVILLPWTFHWKKDTSEMKRCEATIVQRIAPKSKINAPDAASKSSRYLICSLYFWTTAKCWWKLIVLNSWLFFSICGQLDRPLTVFPPLHMTSYF